MLQRNGISHLALRRLGIPHRAPGMMSLVVTVLVLLQASVLEGHEMEPGEQPQQNSNSHLERRLSDGGDDDQYSVCGDMCLCEELRELIGSFTVKTNDVDAASITNTFENPATQQGIEDALKSTIANF